MVRARPRRPALGGEAQGVLDVWTTMPPVTANRARYQVAVRWLALAFADALFLWMIVSVSGVDLLADAAVANGDTGAAESMRRFAADWRHGMNGHSPIFMPGFFALTIAVWYWHRKQSILCLVADGLPAMCVGCALAWIGEPVGSAIAGSAFARQFDIILPPGPTWSAVVVGACTAICWTVLVIAVRNALIARSWRLFALVPVLYGLLGVARDWWSIDHFGRGNDLERMFTRVAAGDAVAIRSLWAIPLLMFVLAGERGLFPTGPVGEHQPDPGLGNRARHDTDQP
jgi:hypothetical protein